MYSGRLFLGIFSFLLFCCLLGCLLLPSPPQPVKRNGGWCWQFGPGPTWLHPVPSHRPQIWLHSRQKSTQQGLEIFEIYLLITDHWSDFLDILSECFFEKDWDYMMFLLENLFENCGKTSRSKMKESWVGPLGVFGPPQPQIIFLLERDWIFFTILPSSTPPTFCKLSN